MFKDQTELIAEYEMTPLTMAILPVKNGSKLFSKIYELNNEVIYSSMKPIDIIKHGCRSYCSSYEGRIDGSRGLVGFSNKVPITIDPTNKMYFFPSESPKNESCVWFSHEHIKDFKAVEKQKVKVIFYDSQSTMINISHYSFNTQMLRTSMLRTKLMKKIESDGQSLIFS